MPKAPIREAHSKVLDGILDLDAMTMDFDEMGRKPLKELLEKFDGEFVTITVKLKNDVID
ncbi:YonK family protein [Candidatus Woesearchaeota archaeon]|nr:YonK family protein [Candidatus Woesearchaeota archaeon]